jgi:hypothetical protein
MKKFICQRFNILAISITLAITLAIWGGKTFTSNLLDSTKPALPVTTGSTWWTSAVIHPISNRVNMSTTTLPVEATQIGDIAWQNAVKNETVKILDTGAQLTGFTLRPIVWAFYVHNSGTYCARPVYKEDGFPVGSLKSTSGGCNTDIIDWGIGTPVGIIRRIPARDQCYQLAWNQLRLNFDDLPVKCPH